MALPCYADEPRDLATLLEQTLRKADLGIARDAREAMVGYLGADRALSLREIEKLALYAQGAGTVTLEHVDAVMADASAVALDTVIDAA
jgi:DNA polymerase-3 subunit delta